eukprot:8906913-Alexandrium_andersonii.AAC.1
MRLPRLRKAEDGLRSVRPVNDDALPVPCLHALAALRDAQQDGDPLTIIGHVLGADLAPLVGAE